MKKFFASLLAAVMMILAAGTPFYGSTALFAATAAAKQNPALAEAQANVKAAH